MISFFHDDEDIANCKRVEPDLDAYPEMLQGPTKFKWFYDQLGLSDLTRLEITKAIIKIVVVHHKGCMSVEDLLPSIIQNILIKVTREVLTTLIGSKRLYIFI